MVAAACVHRSPDAPDVPAGAVVTVMTYNVNYGLAGDAEGIAAIREGGADIVVLQETTAEWERAVRDELSGEYPHMAFRHCCGAGGMAILSTLPFDDADYVESVAGWFPAWRVVVHGPFGALQILNVHLHPPVSESGSVVSGYFSTPPVRKAEIAQFHALVAPDVPAVIAGDFNEQHSGDALRYLGDRGFECARPINGPNTWRWRTSVGTLRQALDHICHDDRVTVVDSRVIRRGRSDHLPVVATFAASP